jgi:hypothetical protein
MNEEKIRKDIRKILIESLDEVHLTLGGKYVPFESEECYRDLANRITDAEAQRNCCDRGTAARMHYNGLLAILRQKSKKHPNHFEKKIKIYENKYSSLLKEATIYSSLIQPFEDILKAGKLTFFTLLSDLWMNLKIIFTLDPKKIQKIKSDYEASQKKLEKKWEPILKRVEVGLENPDLQLMAMLYAPTLWANAFAYDWSQDKIKKLFSSGEEKTVSDLKNKKLNSGSSKKRNFDVDYQTFKSIFIESHQLNNKILMEKNENIDNVLNDFLKENKSDLEEFSQSIENFVSAYEELKDNEILLKKMIDSQNYTDLIKMIDNFNFSNDELKKNILKIIEESYNKSQIELANLNQDSAKAFKNSMIGSQLISKYNLDDEKSKNFEIDDEQLKKDINGLKPIDDKELKIAAEKKFLIEIKNKIKEEFLPIIIQQKEQAKKEFKSNLSFLESTEEELKKVFKDYPDFLNFLINTKNYYKI